MYNETTTATTENNEVNSLDQIHGGIPYEFARDCDLQQPASNGTKEYVRYAPPTPVNRVKSDTKEPVIPLYLQEREEMHSPTVIDGFDDDDTEDEIIPDGVEVPTEIEL